MEERQTVCQSDKEKAPKRLDVSKLKQDSKRQDFVDGICKHFYAVELNSGDRIVLRNAEHFSAVDAL